MKTTLLSAVALAILQVAAGQPHGKGHRHARRDAVTHIEVIEGPDVIVVVDQYDQAITTETAWNAASTIVSLPPSSSSTPPPASSPPAKPSPPSDAGAVDAVKAAAVSSEAPSSTSVASSAAPSATSEPSVAGNGLTWSEYNADSSCKSQSQAEADFAKIPDSFKLVRIYRSDCGGLANVLPIAKQRGMKIMIGVWDLSAVSSEISTITSAVGTDWDVIDTVSIGNEMGGAAPGHIAAAKSQLRASGYNGPVVSVDTIGAMQANPSICQESDYIAANCHPYFDGHTEPSASGDFLNSQIALVKQVCPGKKVVITETGWPTQGDSNGVAVPSTSNQATVMSTIQAAFADDPASIIFLSSFDDEWKAPGPWQVEQHWGFLHSE